MLKTLTNTPGFTCVLAEERNGQEDSRSECLRLVSCLLGMEVRELILEHIDPATMARDKAVIEPLVPIAMRDSGWRHETPEYEPLLWISDLVANAYGAGGELRRMAQPMISVMPAPKN